MSSEIRAHGFRPGSPALGQNQGGHEGGEESAVQEQRQTDEAGGDAEGRGNGLYGQDRSVGQSAFIGNFFGVAGKNKVAAPK